MGVMKEADIKGVISIFYEFPEALPQTVSGDVHLKQQIKSSREKSLIMKFLLLSTSHNGERI